MIKLTEDLQEYTFIIPDYQRSYRWTSREVTDLLNDMFEFGENNDNSRYCLQPLIVKKLNDKDEYEVVDGQQRLTTIFLINEVNKKITKKTSNIYTMKYANRGDTEGPLNNFHKEEEKYNIDCYHMKSAYDTICNWLENSNKSKKIERLLKTIIEKTFFIFYQIPEGQSAEDTYTKINNGKIRLTNAELIKSLLMKDDFTTKPNSTQTAISLKWDQIEQELQDDDFWYFLSNNQNMEPRIDLLFEILANIYREKYNLKEIIHKEDDRWVFFTISHVIKHNLITGENGNSVVDKIWKDLVAIYSRLKSWYIEPDTYHIIGYLLSTGIRDINSVYDLSQDTKKDNMRKRIIEIIKNNLEWGKYEIKELTYDKSSDKKKMRKILLLFNVIAHIKTYNNTEDDGFTGQKFSFRNYKKGKWDLEHIHATAETSSDPSDSLFQNITLLNSDINKSYKNDKFEEKRTEIIKRDRAGKFIPICTKNLFLGCYSSKLANGEYQWGSDEKKAYIKDIEDELNIFLKE